MSGDPRNTTTFKFVWKEQQGDFDSKIVSIRKDNPGFLTDVVLGTNGHYIPCHKLVLAAGSPFFKDMFMKNDTESQKPIVILGNISEAILRKVVDFLYSGQVQVPEKEKLQFDEACAMLQIDNSLKVSVQEQEAAESDLGIDDDSLLIQNLLSTGCPRKLYSDANVERSGSDRGVSKGNRKMLGCAKGKLKVASVKKSRVLTPLSVKSEATSIEGNESQLEPLQGTSSQSTPTQGRRIRGRRDTGGNTPRGKANAAVYEYFSVDSCVRTLHGSKKSMTYKCNLCESVLRETYPHTGNLKAHLLCRHPEASKVVQSIIKQQKLRRSL